MPDPKVQDTYLTKPNRPGQRKPNREDAPPVTPPSQPERS